MDPEMNHTITCPTCIGVADFVPEEQAYVCRRCGSKAPYERGAALTSVRS
jgi:hypothetical protein